MIYIFVILKNNNFKDYETIIFEKRYCFLGPNKLIYLY